MNEALLALERDFGALFADRPAVQGSFFRAMLSQALKSVCSERQLMERLEFDLLFRWFVVTFH